MEVKIGVQYAPASWSWRARRPRTRSRPRWPSRADRTEDGLLTLVDERAAGSSSRPTSSPTSRSPRPTAAGSASVAGVGAVARHCRPARSAGRSRPAGRDGDPQSGRGSGSEPRPSAARVRVGDPLDQPRDAGEVAGAADDQHRQRVPLGGDPLGLADRLADQPAGPQRQPPGQPSGRRRSPPAPRGPRSRRGRCRRAPRGPAPGSGSSRNSATSR